MTAVAKGKMYLSPSIAETVIKNSLEKLDRKDEGSSVLLSGREREVLQMIAEENRPKKSEVICEYQDRGNSSQTDHGQTQHSHGCRPYEIRHSRRSNLIGVVASAPSLATPRPSVLWVFAERVNGAGA